jgi:alpha-D-xyloside xylohydrolase
MRLSLIVFSLFTSSINAHPPRPASTPFSLVLKDGQKVLVNNSAVLIGAQNTTTSPVSTSPSGDITNNGGKITYQNANPHLIKVQVSTKPGSFIGARFNSPVSSLFYGVWEYPFSNKLSNNGIKFDLKGVGNAEGVNWSNARAPFVITSDPTSGSAYGVYADTLSMGSFDFTTPGLAQFIFNTSSLVYYIILPENEEKGNEGGAYKSIISQYTDLSSKIEMPPDSAYGPTFWSDDFTTDFHGTVSNAQENYYDVINHLYYNQIRATSMFADSKHHRFSFSAPFHHHAR